MEIYIAELDRDPESWLQKTGFANEIKLHREEAETRAKNDENFNKAMEMIATGKIVNNPSEEVGANE